ncbi:helix-turn-helix domain-containing protein [bacterium 210917-DFI.7.65]|uniref:helix-turn-helix domain-containing protein n=1 Tax=Ruthenibacterium lactatiformans TaxID=1550024 RepID=UPI002A4C2605|nr:helix-turn-helix domain-containing protein [bacterium 210917-DFI.7.65]
MRPRKKYGTKNSIGKNIIALREKRHMKQGELLAQLQLHNIPISASSLSDLEGQNRHVSEREIIALMDIFQITFEELCSNSFYSNDDE